MKRNNIHTYIHTYIMSDSEEQNIFVMERPMHLVKPERQHQGFSCIPEAIKVLKMLHKPVTVVSLVGSQRGGKSSLLNLLYDRNTGLKNGFGVGHEMDAKTHGLWMWIKHNEKNPGSYILYLDTEGLDSIEAEPFYNWSISALSLLISDLYMYQSKSSIDKSTIDTLAMILSVSQQLRGSGEDGDGNSETQWKQNVADTTSTFLWILRDHQLKFKGLPRSELESKLDPKVLRKITQCFGDDYDCCTLPRPADTAEALQNLDKMGYRDLSEDFKEYFTILRTKIEERLCRQRILAGNAVVGSTIAELLIRYTSAISNKEGALSDISNLPTERQMLNRMFGEKAVNSAVETYNAMTQKSILQRIPLNEDELINAHEEAKDAATNKFEDATSTLDADDRNLYKNELIMKLELWKDQNKVSLSIQDNPIAFAGDKIPSLTIPKLHQEYQYLNNRVLSGGAFHMLWEKNISAADQKCKILLVELYSDVKKNVEMGISNAMDITKPFKYQTVESFFQDIEIFVQQYITSEYAVGPTNIYRMKEFLNNNVVQDSFKVRLVIEKRNARENLIKSMEKVQNKLKTHVEENVVKTFNNNLKEVERSVAKHIVNCENTISEVEKKIARSTENAESLIKSNLVIVRNEYEGLCKKHEEQCQHLEKKIQGSVDQIDQRINGERKEREKMKIDLGDDIRRSKLQQEDDVKRSEKSLLGKIDEVETLLSSSLKKINENIEKAESNLNVKISKIGDKINDDNNKHHKALKELEERIKSDIKAGLVDPLVMQLKQHQDELAEMKKENAKLVIEMKKIQSSITTDSKEAMNKLQTMMISNMQTKNKEVLEKCFEKIDIVKGAMEQTMSNNKMESKKLVNEMQKKQENSLQTMQTILKTNMNEQITLVSKKVEILTTSSDKNAEDSINEVNNTMKKSQAKIEKQLVDLAESFQQMTKEKTNDLRNDLNNTKKSLELCMEEQTKSMNDWKSFLEAELVNVRNDHAEKVSTHQSAMESKVNSLHENHNSMKENYEKKLLSFIESTEKNLDETKLAIKEHTENANANEAVMDKIKTLETWVRKQFSDQGDATIMVSDEVKKLSEGTVAQNMESLLSLKSMVKEQANAHETHIIEVKKRIESIPNEMKKQYTIPIFDLKKDIDAKIMQLKNDVDSVQQNSSTIEKSDSGVTIRRLEAIETALTGYDKHLSTFRSGLTDEIGAEVARQNIVIDSQKNLIAKIEDRVTTLGSHMVNVEAAISGQEPAEKKDEAIKFLNDKVNRIVAGLNREKAKRDENSASMWSALGEVSCRVADVLEQVDSFGLGKNGNGRRR